MTAESYSETTGSVARQAGVLAETVRLYGDLGLLECTRLSNGIRLFKPSAAERVREIYTERMARRGHCGSAVAI